MCGILGLCNLNMEYTKEGPKYLVSDSGSISRKIGNREFTILSDGKLYNATELRQSLEVLDWRFRTNSDAEIILLGFIQYGATFFTKLNGTFAAVIWDSSEKTLFLVRDKLGVKPLFYTVSNGSLVFGQRLNSLFQHHGVTPSINKDSLCEIFGLGPARTPGHGVFKDCHEVLPGNYITFNESGLKQHVYWKIESKPHTDSYEKTIEKTSYLVTDSIKRQMASDTPICTFLSGGVDSSIITAVCAEELKKQGKQLDTFSFDFEGNERFFKANSFQPSRDRPFVEKMVAHFDTNHTFLECTNMDLVNHLDAVVDARNLPGMADVESSLLYFCKVASKYNKVALTGECADEIFGGYPWFHSEEAFLLNTFPWSKNMEPRKMLLKDEVLKELDLDNYVKAAYETSVKETPYLLGESETERRRREISYLNIRWFMATLADRMDRTSMYSGLDARVPLADYRLLEYVWNVPWDIKCKDQVVKHLLRESAKGIVPDEVLYRKKSPYPKTYNPGYENLLKDRLLDVIHNSNAPINQFIDKNKVLNFFDMPSDYGKPWYGQLMAGPQLIAYMIQVNYWMEKYNL